MLTRYVGGLAIGGWVLLASMGAAHATVFTSYSTTMNPGQGPSPVVFGTNVFEFFSELAIQSPGPPASITTNWLYSRPGGSGPYNNSFDISTTTTTFEASGTFYTPSAALMIGVHAENPAEPFDIATDDLVLMVSSTFASSSIGLSFSSVMADDGISEDDLIADIITGYQDSSGLTDYYAALNQEIQFVYDNGPTIGFAFPGTYEVIEFSGGAEIGSGVAAAVTPSVSTPEPTTWALMLVGLLGLGQVRRGGARLALN